MHTIIDNFQAVPLITNNTTGTGQFTWGTFVNMVPFRRAVMLITCPAITANLEVIAYEAEDAAGTGATSIKDGQGNVLTGTFDSDDHDNMVAMIEILEGNLTEGNSFIGVNLDPNGQSPNVSVMFLLTDARDNEAIDNTATSGVAFAVGGLDGATA
jgi:hypothetical protein